MRVEDREPLVGIHPNIVTAERFRYYSVADVPRYNQRTWRLAVDGEGLGGSLKLRFDDLYHFPPHALKATFRCVTGWRVRDCVWAGVRLRDVLDVAQPN